MFKSFQFLRILLVNPGNKIAMKENKESSEELRASNLSSENDRVREERQALSKEIQGNETILVVEDEEQVRELVIEMLQTYGYKVLGAYNGKNAIDIYNIHRDQIKLILTDVVMPEMGGKRLIETLQNFKEDTKVIFMSGYTDNAIDEEGILEPGTEFIQKPFSPFDLLKRIREVLDR